MFVPSSEFRSNFPNKFLSTNSPFSKRAIAKSEAAGVREWDGSFLASVVFAIAAAKGYGAVAEAAQELAHADVE